MGKHSANQKQREKKLLVGFLLSFSSEFKIILTALFVIFSLAAILHLAPSNFSISAFDLGLCISRINDSQKQQVLSSPAVSSSPPPLLSADGVVKRGFNTYGWSAYSFVMMSCYRGGLNTFAVIGLSSKSLQLYTRPTYKCEWIPHDPTQKPVSTSGYAIQPDWGYGRVYTTVVVNCTFSVPVNSNNSGGELLLHTSNSGGGDTERNTTETINALTEQPGEVNLKIYDSNSTKYDYLYCGSSLYGNMSPQRMREWIAYHVRLFGKRSHFVLHDAGGVHSEVMDVLRPWIELGYVTLQDIKEQERFDGYYHNQFMVVNDCLHRYKFMTKWMFFFDVDEYIYIPGKNTIKSVMDSLVEFSQFTIEQMPMSNQLCFSNQDRGRTYRKWGFEKLVYRDVKKVARRDRKYAIQPRYVDATGVHMSQNLVGKTNHRVESRIKYFHYHGAISQRREPCRHLFNATNIVFENNPYVLDTALVNFGGFVKKFELGMIQDKLIRTRQ